ncbi:hypothetical protein [Methylobacterium pseudosasicola]|uniref:Uncharacterized protein n=1 Tax=Methylobacterium pseudosasicola TaxID=582667 RepID=A0A1I4RD64_9HYPH|nr:hypothetical protein [Methylobacterium pseudosasicola]SFM50211.1 hypothetical protein SAMN05192568_10356 [Methylobacterium pseudosasicola]
MARDQSGSAHLSPEDRKASARAGRKRLGADGYPQSAHSPEARDTAEHTTTAARRPAAADKGSADRT